MFTDDDVDPVLLRRRQLKNRARKRLVLATVAGIVVLGFVSGGLLLRAVTKTRGDSGTPGVRLFGPSATSDGESWNHDDLAAHLIKHGVPCVKRATDVGAVNGPACFFCKDQQTADWISSVGRDGLGVGEPGIVYVQKLATPQDAKDQLGGSNAAGFTWGRFLFQSSDKAYVGEMKAALGVR